MGGESWGAHFWEHSTDVRGGEQRDTVTLRCHLPKPAAWVELYQDGLLRSYKDMDKHQGYGASRWAWAFSTGPGPISVISLHSDHRYSPPNISISHEKTVEVGTNVTIQCCNQGYGGIIFLHKDGHSAPLQHQDPHGGGTATFTLFGVTPADSGTYRCSYHPKASLFVSSPLGDSVTLEVTPTLAPPGRYTRPPFACPQCCPWVAVNHQVSTIGSTEGCLSIPSDVPCPHPISYKSIMYPLPPLPDPINYLVPVILCICVHHLQIHYKSTQALPASSCVPFLFSQVQQVSNPLHPP
uniref:Ig-like domain-containing protein n=1 Tax=Gallus gallus TaxID=9031 RepID=A0A8V0XGV9_CHICK